MGGHENSCITFIPSTFVSLSFLSRHREDRQHITARYTAERASLNVETELSVCSPHFFFPLLCCILVLQGHGLRRPGNGHVELERPSSSRQPHLTLLSLSLSLSFSASAFTLLSSDRGNESETHLFSYSFHRLWPLPTCVLISNWRAALHGPQSLYHTHSSQTRDRHNTHTHTVCMMFRRTNQETHQKDVDDIIYDGCNWWWCNSEPMLSEACPLQKHSSHYNKIKDCLEGGLHSSSLLQKIRSNLRKWIVGSVLSVPPFCTLVFPLLSHMWATADPLEPLQGRWGWLIKTQFCMQDALLGKYVCM